MVIKRFSIVLYCLDNNAEVESVTVLSAMSWTRLGSQDNRKGCLEEIWCLKMETMHVEM